MLAAVQSFGPGSSPGIATELPGWTVRESNPGGGEIFRTCSDRPWGPPSQFAVIFVGVNLMIIFNHIVFFNVKVSLFSYFFNPFVLFFLFLR